MTGEPLTASAAVAAFGELKRVVGQNATNATNLVSQVSRLMNSVPMPQVAGGPVSTLPLLAWEDRCAGTAPKKHWMKDRDGWNGPFNTSADDYAFDPSMVSEGNGALTLAWKKQTTKAGDQSYPYAGGIVQTAKDTSAGFPGYEFTPPIFLQIEARFDVVDGIWPALVLYQSGTWPPEVDIAEWVQGDSNAPNPKAYQAHFNVHWPTANGGNDQVASHEEWPSYADQHGPTSPYSMAIAAGVDFGQWHTYGLLWTKDRLQVYFDGIAGPACTAAKYPGSIPTGPLFLCVSNGVRKGATPPDGAMQIRNVRTWTI